MYEKNPLKMLKELIHDNEQYQEGYANGYNKAISDMLNAVTLQIIPLIETEEEYNVAMRSLDEIAEQLKS